MALIRKGGVLTGAALTDACGDDGLGSTTQAVLTYCNGDLTSYSIGDIARSCLLADAATQDQLDEWNQHIADMLDPNNPAHLPATIQQTMKSVIVGCLTQGIPMAFEFNQQTQPNWSVTATPLPSPLQPTSWKFTIAGPLVPG